MWNSIAISSGHGLFVRGARGLIDEVDEARKVTGRVAAILRGAGVGVSTFHENNARTVSDNVGAIVRHHNGLRRDLDVSIHFNSTATGIIEDRAIGVEVLHHTNNQITRQLAGRVARAISDASGLLLRHQRDSGAVARNNLSFLNNTTAPAILIEVCFVNSRTDVRLYQEHFEAICHAIAESICGRVIVREEEVEDMPRWNTISEVPEGLLRNIVQEWVSAGYLQGTCRASFEQGNPIGLDITRDMIRSVILGKRMAGARLSQLEEAVFGQSAVA